MSSVERRRNYRVRTERPVVVLPVAPSGQVGEPIAATTVDLSVNGTSLRLVNAAKVHGRLCVQLRFANPELDLLVFGHTVRSPGPGVIGVRFEGVTESLRRDLTRFVFAEAKRLAEGERPIVSAVPEPADPAPRPRPAQPGRLTVAELAAAIGQTVGSTRRLLNKGLVPGARRIDPTTARSHWIIPESAPDEYLALFRRQDAAAAPLAANG